MNSEISIDIQEKNDIIYCTIKSPRQNYQFPKKVILNDHDIKKLLLDRGYKNIELLKGSHINNKSPHTPCEGIWEFKKIKPPPKRRRVAKKSNK